MDRVARIAAPLFFITMVYAGWRYDLNLPIQPLLSPGPWIVALLIATGLRLVLLTLREAGACACGE